MQLRGSLVASIYIREIELIGPGEVCNFANYNFRILLLLSVIRRLVIGFSFICGIITSGSIRY